MNRSIATALIAGLLAGACAESGARSLGAAPGVDESPSLSASTSPTGSPTTPSPSPSPIPTRTMTYEVWFIDDGYLFESHRTELFTPAVGATAIQAVLDGPTKAETAAHVVSSITPGTRLLGLSIRDGVATVDLDGTFTSEPTPAIAVGSLSQIVYTITQFDSVDSVEFRVEGVPLTNFAGYELDRPQRRADFAESLPAILVTAPAIGQRVSSPVTIAGTADVFEAVVSIAILDADRRVVASTFTMATCGTGCRGTFSADVRYDVAATQPGTIRVFEVSAKDGAPINVVEIPVTLTA